ncbi:LamG domain-containing protein [bacterium]|nr:LamG domain-containing protein [bacterium]
MKKKQSNSQSFTLIELLIVIAIIGILTGIIIVSMTSATNGANDTRRKADINQLVEAITIIKTTDGLLPTETNANCKLGSTNSSENCSGIQAKLTTQGIAIPKDPVSGNYYIYNRVSADDFTISASMSNASTYAYSSANSSYTSSSLVNGSCGSSNNTVSLTAPVSNLCDTGTSTTASADSSTVLLMHMDGVNNGTTFTDQSGKAISRVGNTKTITATKKFGTASAYFDGSGDYLSIPTSTDFDFGTGDFTIDFWVNSDRCGTGDTTDIQIVSFPYSNRITTYNRNAITIQDNCAIGIGLPNSSFTGLSSAANIFQINQWNHIAIVRNGSNLNIYYNGNSVAQSSSANFTFAHPDYNLIYLAAYVDYQNVFYSPRFFRGYIDEFRASKGIARWTTNFTVPNIQHYWWNWNCSGSGSGSSATCGADKY